MTLGKDPKHLNDLVRCPECGHAFSAYAADARRQAMELRAKGMGTTEIARHLGISRNTVWRYINKMRRRYILEDQDHGTTESL